MTISPRLGNIRSFGKIAGQIGYTVEVTYPGEDARFVNFIGSRYGGPVVMLTGTAQTFVTDPGRFGAFGEDGEEWVRRFFA